MLDYIGLIRWGLGAGDVQTGIGDPPAPPQLDERVDERAQPLGRVEAGHEADGRNGWRGVRPERRWVDAVVDDADGFRRDARPSDHYVGVIPADGDERVYVRCA